MKTTNSAISELIDARGTLEPQGTSLMFQLAINRTLTNYTDATSHSVVYPAALDQNITSGSNYLVRHIHSGLGKCPDQRYLLFGYSQGASLVLDGLEKLGAKATEAVASVILVGNPFRVPGRLSNVNRQGHYDNRTAYGRFAQQAQKTNRSIPMLSDTLDRSGRVQDICLDMAEIQDLMVVHALQSMS
ncbi:hypothetical protein PWT90_08730 [Aphanocladium album]|nr:hypothetical protein PWT90_08730 [Aphanocladium album]